MSNYLYFSIIHPIFKYIQNIESQQNPQGNTSDFPLNATATFLHGVKQSPSTVKLLSHTSQQIKTTAGGTRNISIVKNPAAVATPSINTGTTTIYLPVFNSVSDIFPILLFCTYSDKVIKV